MSSITLAARLRAAGLILVGAMALHWLRYLLAYGGAAQEQLDHQGHGYLSEGLPFAVAMAVALIASAGALRVGRIRRAGAGRLELPAVAPYVAALLSVYSAQELTEGFLASGHASGAAALLADHGWIALPLAVAIGWLLARLQGALVRGERLLAGLLVSAAPGWSRPPASIGRALRSASALSALLLAFGFARRPPPGLSVR